MNLPRTLKLFAAAILSVGSLSLLAGCSASRHVPAGSYLLDKVSIETDSVSPDAPFATTELLPYLRQQPNHRILWSMRFRLGLYNMSGNDSTKWWNRWIRKLGEPPVIYDSTLAVISAGQIQRALINKGYLNADVAVESVADSRKKKMKLRYRLNPGTPMTIRSVAYDIPDSTLRSVLLRDSAEYPASVGRPLDRNMLETQRDLITSHMRDAGYYHFSKELVTFTADTVAGSHSADLTMHISGTAVKDHPEALLPYRIGRIRVLTNYRADITDPERSIVFQDSTTYNGLEIYSSGTPYLRPSVIDENCFLHVGQLYSQKDVDRTYQAFSRLSILSFISVRFLPSDTPGLVDAYILLTPGKSQSLSASLEGTNSEGDLGVAVGVGYTHRNVGRGSETLSAKGRAAYESLSGNLEGLLNNRYLELSAELDLSFPKFKAPFLSERFKRRITAASELGMSINYQERPEYTRIISTAGWAYKWSERITGNRHTITPIDINYVYLPKSTNTFLNDIAPDNPLLRYSYEDHFIMRLGYSFYHTNKRRETPWERHHQRFIYTARVNTEVAGNLLFALSSIFNHRSNFHTDPYKIFGIHYSQYFRAEGDFAFVHQFDYRQSVAFHAGAGIGVPYGNSKVLPFEKRFYGGGANGVRGWSVRTLGPGSYPGRNSVSDFINQCGDIRLNLSAEYRAKLFWVVELGLFVDAGNIWTIHCYDNQPGGMFRFNSFYKQIAAAYGVGLRLDFSFFLLRFDLGMKAHNPARGEEPWPLIHPNWRRDHAFHFSIGYPF